jgi:hypothetical protein
LLRLERSVVTNARRIATLWRMRRYDLGRGSAFNRHKVDSK